MKNSMLKIGFVGAMSDNFDGGKFGRFARSAEWLKNFAKENQAEFCCYPEILLTTGDAEAAAAFFRAEKVDFLLTQATTFPGGDMIVKLARAADYLGLWALPEASFEGSNFVGSNNSLCGVNMMASILRNYTIDKKRPYKWFFGDPGDARLARRLFLTVRALSAVKGLANSTTAIVGGIAPGFSDLYYDERLATLKLGAEIRRFEFQEIRERAYAYSDARAGELAAEYAAGQKLGSDATPRHLEMSGRYYQAIMDFCGENRVDALALSCWPQIKKDTLACSVIGKLNENGVPTACEGDAPGAVSMLFLSLLTGGTAALMDMTALDERDDTVLMWHCGPAAPCLAGKEGSCLTCSYQLNLQGETLSYGLINNLKLKQGPVTFTRFAGEWDRLFLADGQIIEDKTSPDGSRGWVGSLRWNRRPVTALDLTNSVLSSGFPHHYPMVLGDASELVMEAASWLELSPLPLIPYEDYRQTETFW